MEQAVIEREISFKNNCYSKNAHEVVGIEKLFRSVIVSNFLVGGSWEIA